MRKSIAAYIKIVSGAVIYACGFTLFIYPNSIISSGVSGIALIINRLTSLPVGTLTIIINIPIFILAWQKLGKAFLWGSLSGMLISSVFIDILMLTNFGFTDVPLLGAVYGGVICGFGLGLVFSAGASTGGVDIVAAVLKLHFEYLNLGQLMLMLDAAVIITGAVVFKSFESAMYAMICVFIMSKTLDSVVYGFVYSKVCYIISDMADSIIAAITDDVGRGVTVLHGKGAYSGNTKNVLMCAVSRQQTAAVKKAVDSVDPKAFMIITDAREIRGNGFPTQN